MHNPDEVEIVYNCPSCGAETVLEPGIERCSGCGGLMPVVQLPDFSSSPYDDEENGEAA